MSAVPEPGRSPEVQLGSTAGGHQPARLAGVRQVYGLCAGWDYMVEAAGSCFAAYGNGVELLGYPADIALLSVAHVHRGVACAGRGGARSCHRIASLRCRRTDHSTN